MSAIVHDVRYSVRLLARQPATTAAILLTLGLGIGANTAVFAVVNAVLLRPLPYAQPDRLVMLWEQRPAENNFTNSVSPADYLDWSRLNASFTGAAAFSVNTADITGAGDPVQVNLAGVTARFFDVLGVQPAVGRTFRAGEDVLGRRRVAVLSHHLWRQRFGSDPAIVGRTVIVNGVPQEVIGVLRSDFEFPGDSIELWAPLVLEGGDAPAPRAAHYLRVYARLRPGVSLDHAQADMTRIGARLSAEYPRENEGHGPRVVSLQEDTVAPARRGLLMVMSAVAFLLLIACANVANLLLARSAGRRRELAVRSAVGASRGRLLRQSLTESVVLAVIGGFLGLLIARWALQLLIAETPASLRGAGLDRARLDFVVLAFTAFVCGITGALAGALPAWQVRHDDLGSALREGGGRPSLGARRGVRMALTAAQVALAVLLLVGAGLMTRTLLQVLSQSAGVETADRLTVNITLPRSRYGDRDAVRRARRALDERFTTTAGLLAFGANNNLPLTGSDSRSGITVEGLQRTPGDNPVRAHVRIVTPGYFPAAGIALRSGRTFSEADDERAAFVVVVNETMAKRYWPGQSALGKRMRFNSEGDPWREVIGVIVDVKHWGLDQDVNPEVYLPHAQQPSSTLTYVLHAAADPMALVPAIEGHVKAVDPDLPLGAVRTFDEVAARSMAARRWSALLLGAFALLGLVLAAAGIYGVMSHAVALRSAEIGIRLSLGAVPLAMLRDVLVEAMTNASVGLAAGLLAGLATTRVLQTLLFGIAPLDPVTFVTAAALVVLMAMLAALLPALRAMWVDPLEALRRP
jgi:putative ABC transport system permease protein